MEELRYSVALFLSRERRPVAVLVKSTSRVEVYDPSTRAFAPLTEELAAELNPLATLCTAHFPRGPSMGWICSGLVSFAARAIYC